MKTTRTIIVCWLLLLFPTISVSAQNDDAFSTVSNDGTIETIVENDFNNETTEEELDATPNIDTLPDTEVTDFELDDAFQEESSPIAIFGKDNRQFVANTNNFPHSAVVQLVMTFGNRKYVGSGNVIANKYILTAAHNLYDIESQTWAKNVTIVPGAYPVGNNSVGSSFKKTTVKRMTVPESWVKTLAPSEDIGIIEVNENIGQYTGNFGVTMTVSNRATLTGFHADKYTSYGQPRMSTEEKNINSYDNRFIAYKHDNSGGSSGSGLYSKNNYQIFGINAYGPNGHLSDNSSKNNTAVRINKKWFDFIGITTKQTPPAQKINQTVTVTSGSYTLWKSFTHWTKVTNKQIRQGDIYRAKYKYTHFNGRTYYSLYDSRNNWIGYLDAGGLCELKAQPYHKNVTIKSRNYTIWGNFFWNSKRGNTKNELGKTYRARYVYKNGNGATYISIYDGNGKWRGYINQKATSDLKATYVGKQVKITKPRYTFWRNFFWSSKMGNTTALVDQTYNARYVYRLGDGKTYYSLYSADNKWLGYLNTNATR